jgi:hypothetical protein
MGFDYPDDNILATAVAANSLAEHVVRLADSRRIPQEEFEDTALSGWRRLFQPLFGGLGRHKRILFQPGCECQLQSAA